MTEEKFNKLCEDVAVIKSKLENLPKSFPCQLHEETFEDHENRLRRLENYVARFIGAIVLGNILTGIIVALIVAYITTGRL